MQTTHTDLSRANKRYKCKRRKSTADEILPRYSTWSAEAPYGNRWGEHILSFSFPHPPDPFLHPRPLARGSHGGPGVSTGHLWLALLPYSFVARCCLILHWLLFRSAYSCPEAGNPPSFPWLLSLTVSNPTALTPGHLFRLRSVSCPEVMSHFGDGGLHVKGALCNFGFHRRESSLLLPPPQFPASSIGAQPSELSSPPPRGGVTQAGKRVTSLAGGWHSSLLSLLPFPVCRTQAFPFVLPIAR